METEGEWPPGNEELSSHWAVAVGVEGVGGLGKTTEKFTISIIMSLHGKKNSVGIIIIIITHQSIRVNEISRTL